jgi:hypothetical protein
VDAGAAPRAIELGRLLGLVRFGATLGRALGQAEVSSRHCERHAATMRVGPHKDGRDGVVGDASTPTEESGLGGQRPQRDQGAHASALT